jgi:hypothetical protein
MLPTPFYCLEVPVLSRRLTRRCLAAAVAAVAATLTLAAPPASAATGAGASAYVSTRVDDPGDALGRPGNVHTVQFGVDANPEGAVVAGEVVSYICEPGQLLGDCDRYSRHRLVVAGPVSVRVRSDGSAQVTATVAEVAVRDGRQLRVFEVDLAVGPGNLTLRQNCICGFTGPDGTTYTQDMFVKQWTGATASGTIGDFDVVAGPSTPATTGKYWVKSSVPQ